MIQVTSLAVQSAVLPFLQVWKALDPAFDVVSLESPSDSWKQLLAGQQMGLSGPPEKTNDIPQNTAVATAFSALDTHDAQTLESWAREVLPALRPGGLIVLGGSNPEHIQTGQRGLFPAAATQAFSAAGYARVCVIRPDASPNDTSLSNALYGGPETYAVVAQAPASGKGFDVFSPVFLEAASTTPQALLRRAEDAIDGRLAHAEAHLHDRITHLDTTFHTQLQHSETALHQRLAKAETALRDRLADIEHLHQTIAELQRLTRRRGLRKLMHRFKQKRRNRGAAADLPIPATAQPAPPPAQVTPPESATPPAPPQTGAASDPVPLSPHEARLRARLFGAKGG